MKAIVLKALLRGMLLGSGAALLSAIAPVAVAQPSHPPLRQVADVPLPGPPVRFDYQTFDPATGRLYIAHMNADHLVIFDVKSRRVLANLSGFTRVHGVLAVPSQHRVYASATGDHQVFALNAGTLQIVAHAGPVNYPDGLAFAPATQRLFVSDEHGGVDAVFDTHPFHLLRSIPLGGGAGNTVYDANSGHILVAVHHLDQLAVIDPSTLHILYRLPLPGIADPHGIALDPAAHLAFVAGEANHSLAVVDLTHRTVLSRHTVGDDPDVLAFDPGLQRLYVAAESGTVTVFQLTGTHLARLGTLQMPHAHSVSVDPATHLVYFPLQDLHGHPVLRIMRP
jgi:DNA-binding beta-propeller fold protein YncE